MKSLVITLAILCIAAVTGTIVYLNMPKAQPAIPRVAEVPHEPAAIVHERRIALVQPTPQIDSAELIATNKTPAVTPASTEVVAEDPAKSSPLNRAIEVLVSAQSSFDDKQAAWKQLREANQLDQAIDLLKQGTKSNPTSAEYTTVLGEAYLQKAGVVSRSGGNINEMGILGMQADQSFDSALKLDPANWDAQFFKAAALAHWPAELNKGDEVVQRFSALIDQQETMALQPHFAKPYILLGEQYQRMGKTDFATATWQLGATKFPGDPVLQKKIKGQ